MWDLASIVLGFVEHSIVHFVKLSMQVEHHLYAGAVLEAFVPKSCKNTCPKCYLQAPEFKYTHGMGQELHGRIAVTMHAHTNASPPDYRKVPVLQTVSPAHSFKQSANVQYFGLFPGA